MKANACDSGQVPLVDQPNELLRPVPQKIKAPACKVPGWCVPVAGT